MLIRAVLVSRIEDVWPHPELPDCGVPQALRNEYPQLLFDFTELAVGVDAVQLYYPFVSYDFYHVVAVCLATGPLADTLCDLPQCPGRRVRTCQ